MFKQNYKFSIGDKVCIIDKGAVFPYYTDAFKKLGFKNKKINPLHKIGDCNEWEVFAHTKHGLEESFGNIYGIRNVEDEDLEILIQERGIQCKDSSNFKNLEIGSRVFLVTKDFSSIKYLVGELTSKNVIEDLHGTTKFVEVILDIGEYKKETYSMEDIYICNAEDVDAVDEIFRKVTLNILKKLDL